MSDKSPRQRHVQEVHEVDQGEARREAREGARRDPLRADPPHQEEVSLLRLGSSVGRPRRTSTGSRSIPTTSPRLDPDLAARITLEHGYGARFGRADAELAPHVAGFASREELLERSDVVLLLKPQHEDVGGAPPGQTLWGWPHCVQDRELTQIAIDRGLTLIAFEAMNHWTRDDAVGLHVFHKNNELAGYCSVLHALQLIGITGDYGRRLTAVVIGFGATARGAVTALSAHGIHDVVGADHPRRRRRRRRRSTRSGSCSSTTTRTAARATSITDRGRVPLAPFLAERDIVVNCTLQDPAAPLIYLRDRGPRRRSGPAA